MATSFCNQFEFDRQRSTYDLFSLRCLSLDIIANIKCYLTETNNTTRLCIIKLNGASILRFIRGCHQLHLHIIGIKILITYE